MRDRKLRLTEGYDVAQICANGHLINSSSEDLPKHNQDFCSSCGAHAVTSCQKCNTPIRGYFWGGGFIGATYVIPRYCHSCGEPYPWTAARIEAAQELAQELTL